MKNSTDNKANTGDKLSKNNIISNMLKDIWANKYPILIILIGLVVYTAAFGTLCPIARTFHIPCPGCGLTRSCISIFRLRFKEAMYYNPAGPLWIAYILFLLYYRYKPLDNQRLIKAITILVCAVTVVVYLYRLIFHVPFPLS